VTRRLSMDKTIFGDDFAFLQSVAGDAAPKQTIPAPVDGSLPGRSQGGRR